MTRNFGDNVSDIFYVCLSIKKAFFFLSALLPVLHGCHPHIYLSLWKNDTCKLAGNREMLILVMANANASLYQLFKPYLYSSYFFLISTQK